VRPAMGAWKATLERRVQAYERGLAKEAKARRRAATVVDDDGFVVVQARGKRCAVTLSSSFVQLSVVTLFFYRKRLNSNISFFSFDIILI
jgi:hypothetical protein